jgi:hypothetical protein
MSYYGDYYEIFLYNDYIPSNTITMQPINPLTFNVQSGNWYEVEFNIRYNVNATTTGTGWNFEGGTAIISNYAFRSDFASTATANYNNNYAARNQNFTTAQTSRINDNDGKIIIKFKCTTSGTIIPYFRSELAGAVVTVKEGTYLKIKKLN